MIQYQLTLFFYWLLTKLRVAACKAASSLLIALDLAQLDKVVRDLGQEIGELLVERLGELLLVTFSPTDVVDTAV